MNNGATSKEAIMEVCRQIAAEKGLDALNMRTVAARCGIAPGTLYNYYADKDELVIAAIANIWKNIFHAARDDDNGMGFAAYTAGIFARIRQGAAQYPNFLTAHSLSIAGAKKGEAKTTMESCCRHIKEALLQVLRADPAIKSDVFSAAFSETDFIDFVFDNILLLLVQEKNDCAFLVELIRRTIYA